MKGAFVWETPNENSEMCLDWFRALGPGLNPKPIVHEL